MYKFVIIISLVLASKVTGETVQSFNTRDAAEQNLIFTGVADTFNLLHQMNEIADLKQQFCLPEGFRLQEIHARAAYSTTSQAFIDDPTSVDAFDVSFMVLIGLQAMFECE
jgi:hypothetical protein